MSDNPFGVQRATPDDAEALLDFLVPIYAENALQPVSAAKLRTMVRRCVELDQAIAGVIRGIPNSKVPVIASVGLMIEEFDYTDEPHLTSRWLNVHPAHRKENYATRLVGFAKWCQEAMQKQVERPLPLFLEILTREPLESKLRLYQRSTPQVGAFFSWGCAPEGQFDQLRMGNGRGTKGRITGRPDRVGLHHPSPILRRAAATG